MAGMAYRKPEKAATWQIMTLAFLIVAVLTVYLKSSFE